MTPSIYFLANSPQSDVAKVASGYVSQVSLFSLDQWLLGTHFSQDRAPSKQKHVTFLQALAGTVTLRLCPHSQSKSCGHIHNHWEDTSCGRNCRGCVIQISLRVGAWRTGNNSQFAAFLTSLNPGSKDGPWSCCGPAPFMWSRFEDETHTQKIKFLDPVVWLHPPLPRYSLWAIEFPLELGFYHSHAKRPGKHSPFPLKWPFWALCSALSSSLSRTRVSIWPATCFCESLYCNTSPSTHLCIIHDCFHTISSEENSYDSGHRVHKT